MAKPNLAALLKQLDEARTQHGSVSELRYLQLLTSGGRVDLVRSALAQELYQTPLPSVCAPARGA